MSGRSSLISALSAVLLASLAMSAAASAQAGADTHGLPTAAQLAAKDNQKTVPVKITTRDYDLKKLLSGTLSPEATVGQALWQQRCAYCHDGMGQPTYKTLGPWIDSDMVKALGPDVMKSLISAGTPNMPAFKYGLSDQQIDDVVEFLKTVSPSLKPTPAQLEGKSVAPGNNAE
jgi:mono/diheme cytochrome c family protein